MLNGKDAYLFTNILNSFLCLLKYIPPKSSYLTIMLLVSFHGAIHLPSRKLNKISAFSQHRKYVN